MFKTPHRDPPLIGNRNRYTRLTTPLSEDRSRTSQVPVVSSGVPFHVGSSSLASVTRPWSDSDWGNPEDHYGRTKKRRTNQIISYVRPVVSNLLETTAPFVVYNKKNLLDVMNGSTITSSSGVPWYHLNNPKSRPLSLGKLIDLSFQNLSLFVHEGYNKLPDLLTNFYKQRVCSVLNNWASLGRGLC